METQLSDTPSLIVRTPVKSRKIWIAAAAALVLVLAAVVIFFVLRGGARYTARGLARALMEGDGRRACELLPERVIGQIAGETDTDEELTRTGVEETLGGLVSAYGGGLWRGETDAVEKRELAGDELERLRELYGQIGLKLGGAAGVDVRVDTGDGRTFTVPVTVVKIGLRWYADYTSLDDTAYRIAHLGK